MKRFILGNATVILVCGPLLSGLASAKAADYYPRIEVLTQADSDAGAQSAPKAEGQPIVIQEVFPDGKKKATKEVAWLGVAVEESSEALSSQLGLKSGEGLTVDFLAAESPAAKADFRKNDVLVDLDGQMLVHPLQFRKLIRMHADGDTIKVMLFRGGKKQTVSVKLGKTTWDEASNQEDMDASSKLESLGMQLNGLNSQLGGMSRSIAIARLDKGPLDAAVNITLEQTRKAIRDAVQRASSTSTSANAVALQLDNLAQNGVDADGDATVIVRNKHNSSRTIVQTDDSGTYIIEAGAKTHLTARDKHGKSLFDGEIDTEAQRDLVPKEVWEKVESLYDQIAEPQSIAPKAKDKKSDE